MLKSKISEALKSPPPFIHTRDGETSGNFHSMFKDQCRKIQDSHLRVKTVESNPPLSDSFYTNYDLIQWRSAGTTLTKML